MKIIKEKLRMKNPKGHSRTKNIDIKYYYVREVAEKKSVRFSYCPTDQTIADILMKGLPKPKFEKLRSLLGVNIMPWNFFYVLILSVENTY